jgi:hypothetical protein
MDVPLFLISMAQAFAALPLATWQPAFQFGVGGFAVSHGFPPSHLVR